MKPATSRAFLVFRRRYWPWCGSILALIGVIIFVCSAYGWLPRLAWAFR